MRLSLPLLFVFLAVDETSAFLLLAVIGLCTSAAYYALCAEDNNYKLRVYGWKKCTPIEFRPSA